MKWKNSGSYLSMVSVLIALTVVFMIAGCSGSSDSGGSGSAVTLSGTVIDAASQSPVNSATVTMDSKTATTTEDGTYTLSNLSSGTFTLTVTASGYENYEASITLVEGTNKKNIELTAASTPKGKLTGIITYDGTPLEGVTVNLGNEGSTVTGTDGVYSFNDLTYGTYPLTLSKTGYAGVSVQVTVDSAENTYSFAMSTSGGLPEPEEGKGHIRGYVTDENGTPLANVKCTLYSLSEKTAGKYIIVYTDENGQYVFLNVTPGSYQVAFILAGYTIGSINTIVTANEIDEPSNPPATPNDPGGGGSLPSTVLQGTVTGSAIMGKKSSKADIALSGVTVTCDGKTCTTDAQGGYKFENIITPGSQAITASKNGYADYSGTVDVVQYKTTVKDIYIAKKWSDVGGSINLGAADYLSSLFVSNGTPYIAYSVTIANIMHVKKYENGAWSEVGDLSAYSGEINSQSLYVDNGTPYLVFSNMANLNKLVVLKYDGGSWQPLPGCPLTGTAKPSITIKSGVVYVAFISLGNGKVTVWQYDGAWNVVGVVGGISEGWDNRDLRITTDSGNVYVSYIDYNNGRQVSVMKFDGNWSYVGGSPGVSPFVTYTLSMAVNAGTVWLGCGQTILDSEAAVMKYDGSWNQLGETMHNRADPWVFFDSGALNMAFKDGDAGGKLSVKKYVNGDWTYVGASGFSESSAVYPSLFIENGTYYVAYSYLLNGNYYLMVKTYTP